ncbi:cysteine hydrolase family protein [Paraburkholderia fungorum]|uniref:cysteine hydrolase family protein n=1 Tax=Paraburkholderia fungorum TaxID=134537 RepID=UPI0038BBF8AE
MYAIVTFIAVSRERGTAIKFLEPIVGNSTCMRDFFDRTEPNDERPNLPRYALSPATSEPPLNVSSRPVVLPAADPAKIGLFAERYLLMTTLTDRPNTALVVIDLQNEVVANAYRRHEVLDTVNMLIGRARSAKVPVVWVRHADEDLKAGSEAWQIVAELSPAPGEAIVEKSYRDAFDGTDLEQVLSRLGVGKLLVTGAQTDMCVRSTLHGAVVRGYDAILVSDAHTTEDMTQRGAPPPDAVIRHTNLYWSNQRAPGRTGGVIASKDVEFAR